VISIRRVESAEPDVQDFLEVRQSAVVARRGELLDALSRPKVIAYHGDAVAGVLTYDVVGGDCEVLTLHVAQQWAGVGTLLISEVARIAVGLGCSRYWVVTTNDNIDAFRFYQRRGFCLAAVRCGAVEEARRSLKPNIPWIGNYGIPLRDEIELTQQLPPPDAPA
jgi:GNAT superfamily N-acetyltransferase